MSITLSSTPVVAGATTYSTDGHQAEQVLISVDVRTGVPSFTVEGLGMRANDEMYRTVAAAIAAGHFDMPKRKITVRTTPAKRRLDSDLAALPIALALLAATGQLDPAGLAMHAAYGQLHADGTITPARGTYAVAEAAHRDGMSLLTGQLLTTMVPAEVKVVCTDRLGLTPLLLPPSMSLSRLAFVPWVHETDERVELADIHGQERVIEALQVAAIGGHHVLLVAAAPSPAAELATVLPALMGEPSAEARAEIRRTHSAHGIPAPAGRPLRALHPALGFAGEHGGGAEALASELQLAHHGVLLLEDIESFSLDTLAEIVLAAQRGSTVVHRDGKRIEQPVNVQLVATVAACMCGREFPECQCTSEDVIDHQSRLKHLYIELFDLVVKVGAGAREPDMNARMISTESAAEDVQDARERLDDVVGTTAVDVQARLARAYAALEGAEQIEARHVGRAALQSQLHGW
jgi:magnesium chelatase family protein